MTFVLILTSVSVFATSNILVVGDSLSSGHGINIKYGWVNLLNQRLEKQKLNYKVINASISGDTTSSGMTRLPKLLQQYQPKIVIIELGGNDGLRGLSLTAMQENLLDMVMLSKKHQAKVVIVGVRLPPNYGKTYREKFHEIFGNIAKQQKIAYVPYILKDVAGHTDMMQSDGIHPTQIAQPQVLENIWEVLSPMLKK